jgi:Flp pilus assembly protein TadD
VGSLLQSGQAEKAAEASRRMVECNADFAPAHYSLAMSLQALGREQEAETHLARAKELGYPPA